MLRRDMPPDRDPASWGKLEASIVRLIKPHVPRAQESVAVDAHIQDGVPVAFLICITLQVRPGTFDSEAVAGLVPLLEKVHAVTVRYGKASFGLVEWKLNKASILKIARSKKKPR